VLFCDIRNFTTLAEGISPEATVKMLNEFFNRMTDMIFATEGLVDKFVGDQIMAFWGAPLACGDHAARACEAALRMREEFLRLRSRWTHHAPHLQSASAEKVQWTINCGLGINTGAMVVGNIGSDRRFSYTVIGDSLNIAARLEALNKIYGTQILVGPETLSAAEQAFRFREIDDVQVKGRRQAIAVSELLGRAGEASLDADWLGSFSSGLSAWRNRDWTRAQRAFAAALARNPSDAVAALYLQRLAPMESPGVRSSASKA
jgi:adenylate cyclase